jgi:DNA repair ATPase RecN
MADEPDNIVLQYLRRFDEKLDRIGEDVRELKVRVTHVEENQTIVHRRLDRVEQRLDRIERRLELTGSPLTGFAEE